MANDVTIVVEASLGDTLLKLELAKHAVEELDDAGSSAAYNLGDDSNRNSFSSRIRNLRAELSNMGDRGPLGTVIRGFGNLASAMLAPIDLGMKFAKNFEQLGTVGQSLVGVVASLTIGWVGLAAAIAAVTFAATALASILGTLIAIVADLIAPVTLLAGLLGGLAAGFVIGGKRAAEGGGKLNEFSKIVDQLGSMFAKTSNILAHVFLPYFVELGHAAKQALLFLDRIVKLPLGEAFRAIDKEGVPMLGKFVDRVAEVLSKPIKLAFRVAFDDTAFSNMVSDWWHRFTGFLFGSVQHHPIEVRPGFFKMENKTVDGVFQPFIDWFNRHHFTRQGIQIGRQILAGVLNSGMRDRLGAFFADVFKDAAKRSLRAFVGFLFQPMIPLLNKLANAIVSAITPAARRAASAVKDAMGSAWDWVKDKVSGIWDWIVQKIETPFHISIDWPSPPGWLTSWLGGGAGGGGGPIHPDPGGGGSNPGVMRAGASFRPRVAMAGAPMIVVNVHGADLSDAPTRKRIAQKLGKEIAADWRRRADGH